ncbi:MAG: hypothetical protein ACRDQ7_06145 [Haloechinothrix sp.]
MDTLTAAHAVDWGSVPDWFAGIGTILAVVFAALAVVAASGQLRALRNEAAEREQEQIQFQAARVAAWLDMNVGGQFVAMFSNRSGLPVYEVTIGFVSPNNDNLIRFAVMAPTDQAVVVPVITNFVRDSALQNPNIMHAWTIRSDTKQPVKSLVEKDDGSKAWEVTGMTGPLGLTITFTDMENRRWHRHLNGSLTSVELDHNVVRSALFMGPATCE